MQRIIRARGKQKISPVEASDEILLPNLSGVAGESFEILTNVTLNEYLHVSIYTDTLRERERNIYLRKVLTISFFTIRVLLI